MANNVSQTDRKLSFEPQSLSKLVLNRASFSKRKFSFPAALHANLLGLSTNTNGESSKEPKRRFSNVGDVVSRKLSTTIGWRSQNVPPDEVISQGRVLCGQYIRSRLKRNGIFNKKLGLYRIRSMIGISSNTTAREVFPSLLAACVELERMHPKLYINIARQTCVSPGGVLVSDKTAAGLLVAIGHELLKTDITWGKVVSLYAVAGGIAVDCVCQGHPEYIHGLMEGITEILEDDIADWVATNGGWMALSNQCRCPDTEITLVECASIFVLGLGVLLVGYFIVRLFL